MEKNVSSVAEQDKTAEVKKNPKLIELARPYKFDDKEYTEIDLSGLDDLTIKDAVLIIKKLYNEGEMAVMITPETATAYTDALAAAATKLPIEFFQLLPIGASKKVRQTVQASLRSAAAEEDGDEDEHSHIMKFGKPYTYKGEKYTEVDLSGVANLTGMNVRQAENRMEEEDIRAAEKTLNYYYCCLIASMATGKDVAFFLGGCTASRRGEPQGFFRLKGGYKTIRKAAIALATATHTSADFYLNLPVRELVEINEEVAEEWQKIKP